MGQASRGCSPGFVSSDTSQAGETMNDRHTTAPIAESPPYAIAAGVAVCALALYVLTLAPTTQFWDASEYITAAHALGIPHPPGNPSACAAVMYSRSEEHTSELQSHLNLVC